jgi:hypothetical protein
VLFSPGPIGDAFDDEGRIAIFGKGVGHCESRNGPKKALQALKDLGAHSMALLINTTEDVQVWQSLDFRVVYGMPCWLPLNSVV